MANYFVYTHQTHPGAALPYEAVLYRGLGGGQMQYFSRAWGVSPDAAKRNLHIEYLGDVSVTVITEAEINETQTMVTQ